MHNKRIEEACRSPQRCANYWLLESKIASRHPQNPFLTVSVKSGNAHNEPMMSAFHPIANEQRTQFYVGFVP
jgi:hypothetical protein